MLIEILAEADISMTKAVQALERELSNIRTGRASASLVEEIEIEAYGATQPIKAVASVSVPEARMLVLQPWDKSLIEVIERALEKSSLGITPGNDGNVIRLPFPPLSEDRRNELVKIVFQKVEESKVSLRNVRRSAIEDIREAEKVKMVSEDDARRAVEDLGELTQKQVKNMDEAGKRKEGEVLEV